MSKNDAFKMFSFCMDVFRFYVLVFMLVYLGWLTQSGIIQPLGNMIHFF